MSEIDSFGVVYYTFIFLVSGYIVDSIVKTIMPVDRIGENILFIRYMAYGVIDFCALSLIPDIIVPIHPDIDKITAIGNVELLRLTSAVVLSSSIIGVIIGQARKSDITRKFFEIFGSHTKHPIPTSWEYFFDNCENGAWIEVHLTTGETILGAYSNNSFASSDMNNIDIFFESTRSMVKGEEGENRWSDEDAGAMWVAKESIKYLKIFSGD